LVKLIREAIGERALAMPSAVEQTHHSGFAAVERTAHLAMGFG
jgi:hypothetical protein